MKTIYPLAAAILITLATSCKSDESRLGITDSGSSGEAATTEAGPAANELREPPKADYRTENTELKDGLVSGESFAANSTKTTYAANDARQESSPAPQPAPKPTTIEKKLIKTGTLNMEVEDYKATRKKINSYIPKFDAYIGGENETNNGGRMDGTITIRVPFNQFDRLMEAIAGEGEYIANKTVNVDDVTSEYIDLEARLKTKLEVEARYRDILKQAHKIPDVLSVENELRVIREEIEAAQGRMKYINDQTTYSTLTVQMYQILPYQVTPQAGFFSKLAESVVSGWRGLLGFVVGIAGIWPLLAFMTVAFFVGRRLLRSKKLV